MTPEPHTKPTLLVVDDEPSIRFVLDEYFTDAGWSVVCAATQTEAASVLEQKTFDVVVLDLRLAKGDRTDGGIALAEQIVRRRAGTRTIVLTGYGSPKSREAALAKGVDAVLDKPIRLEVLHARIKELTGGDEPQTDSASQGAREGKG
jgi:CheY-like chemotaxis protein